MGALAVLATVASPLLVIGRVHGAYPGHMDFSGRVSGTGSAAPLFVFAGIAFVDGLALTALYISDRKSKRLPAAFWFLIAVALWWLVSAQAGFVTAALHVNGVPWGWVNVIFGALLASAVGLLLMRAFRKEIST